MQQFHVSRSIVICKTALEFRVIPFNEKKAIYGLISFFGLPNSVKLFCNLHLK